MHTWWAPQPQQRPSSKQWREQRGALCKDRSIDADLFRSTCCPVLVSCRLRCRLGLLCDIAGPRSTLEVAAAAATESEPSKPSSSRCNSSYNATIIAWRCTALALPRDGTPAAK